MYVGLVRYQRYMVDGVSRQASKTTSRLSTLIVSQAWLDGKKVINSTPLHATSSPDCKTAKFLAFNPHLHSTLIASYSGHVHTWRENIYNRGEACAKYETWHGFCISCNKMYTCWTAYVSHLVLVVDVGFSTEEPLHCISVSMPSSYLQRRSADIVLWKCMKRKMNESMWMHGGSSHHNMNTIRPLCWAPTH